ncbi:L-threonylcarbamoyladenylate synthase [Oscillatoria sp. FACHB-1407]|uniref:L-threonylcarbamoyladenylate synthase n=1 Tax=Oscillatoria sp. FACHB-1407 TaxID=2692847 RepID=UPI0016859BA7|nr:L-threonylcarbamoyladenylate synthase [Oscillatoria sp. FACHB-1407]MBD2464290.1 L-threonylcarbamoyladenylate synthase [Oscillatoria sp. FACHB-1407]
MPQVTLTNFVKAAQTGDRVLSFPTDTVPALAARPERADLIFATKQRSQTKPLILMAAEATDLWQFVTGSDAEWQIWKSAMEQHWPGALTLVLPASDRLPRQVNPLDPTTIGIRVPNSAIARHILRQTGPLATTSANLSGQPPLQTQIEIETHFPEVLTLLPSDLETLVAEGISDIPSPSTPTGNGTPSTVAQWTQDGWKILRQGNVTL